VVLENRALWHQSDREKWLRELKTASMKENCLVKVWFQELRLQFAKVILPRVTV
jgi:hypothetical protein